MPSVILAMELVLQHLCHQQSCFLGLFHYWCPPCLPKVEYVHIYLNFLWLSFLLQLTLNSILIAIVIEN